MELLLIKKVIRVTGRHGMMVTYYFAEDAKLRGEIIEENGIKVTGE